MSEALVIIIMEAFLETVTHRAIHFYYVDKCRQTKILSA